MEQSGEGEGSTLPEVETEDAEIEKLMEELSEMDNVDTTPLPEPILNKEMDLVLLIEGLPITVKVDRLMKVVMKKITIALGSKTPISLSDYLHFIPLDPETKESKGYLFIELQDEKEANRWQTKVDGMSLDKQHRLKAYFVSEIESGDIQGQPKEIEEFKPGPRRFSWLLDERARMQFVIRYHNSTEVYWFDAQRGPELAFSRDGWSEHSVVWSPYGTYIASFHSQGIALWGGDEFSKINRFPDEGVKMTSWSPKEKFFVTWVPRGRVVRKGKPKSEAIVKVWNVETGKAQLTTRTYSDDGTMGRSPFIGSRKVDMTFQWSHDEQYFARIVEGLLEIYDSTKMKLCDDIKLRKLGITHFSLSPRDNLLAAWIPKPDEGEKPARFAVFDLKLGVLVKQKSYYRPVKNRGIYWQTAGLYVAAVVEGMVTSWVEKEGERPRRNQPVPTVAVSKLVTSIDVVNVGDGNYPIENTELEGTVAEFEWEPKRDRFAVVHRATQNQNDKSVQNNNVLFYTMKGKERGVDGLKLTQIKMLERVPVDRISWSPRGTYVLLANFSHQNGALEFWDIDEIELLGIGEHRMATDIEWDPSGRFVATYISAYSNADSHGYCIWTFQGDLVENIIKNNLIQFSWRPQPPSYLTAEDEKSLQANIKEYFKKYRIDDEKWGIHKKEESLREKLKVVDEFRVYERQMKAQYLEEAKLRGKLRGGYISGDDEFVEEKSTEEETLSVVTTVLE